jgi:hypothetical protein
VLGCHTRLVIAVGPRRVLGREASGDDDEKMGAGWMQPDCFTGLADPFSPAGETLFTLIMHYGAQERQA